MARLALGFALAATSLLNISAAHEAAAKPATRGAAPGLRGAPRGRGVARGRGSAGPGLRGTASQGAPTGALKRGAAPGAVRGATRGRGKPAPAARAPLDEEMAALSLKEKPATAAPADAGGSEAGPVLEKLLGMALDDDRKKAAGELVAVVAKHGLAALESMGIIPTLAAALEETGKAGGQRAGAMAAIDALSFKFGSAFEPWTVRLLPQLFDTAGHKNGGVAKTAQDLTHRIVIGTSPSAVRLLLPTLFAAMKHDRAPVKVLALQAVKALAEGSHRKQVASELYEVVPVLSEMMWDCKDEVVAAANEAMVAACSTADNRDLAAFTGDIIGCVTTPENVPDCVHRLAATVFVQEIKSAALAVTVPLLTRGLNERDTVIRRKACTIIDNMCKMIENPEEAVAFMPHILPLVARASEEIADPEARGVAAKALSTLEGIKAGALEAKSMEVDAVLSALHRAVPALEGRAEPALVTAVQYAASLCSVLVSNRDFEPSNWATTVEGNLKPFLDVTAEQCAALREQCFKETRPKAEIEDMEEEGEDLCNIEFSLGYGAMMLLTNTRLHLKRGKRYGLCGHNGCGKSTLMRAIVNGQVEGFPPPTELRTVYVEHDIQAADATSSVTDFIFKDERLNGESREEVVRVLASVGFDEKMREKQVTALSGGWKMKAALARAMLMKADIFLLDEPTNHLDVTNVAWLENYLTGLDSVTSVIVSHDSGFLDRVCTHITHFEKNRKLKTYRGNLSEFVKARPEAKAYYELASETLTFTLPEPGFLEGVKSKGKAILKMSNVYFTYPGNTEPTVRAIGLQASLSSRVAVIGPNGAGKSTIIKLLTGELKPDSGETWKHPNMRIAYVAQHAFHHLEKHTDKTPNEYIQWRYAGGEDKEKANKEAEKITEEEQAKMDATQELLRDDGTLEKAVVESILTRRKHKSGYEYEVKFVGKGLESNMWLEREKLIQMGFQKMVNRMDEREALRLGTSGKALTAKEVEKALGNMGLEPEFATHNRILGLSGGQKVKVVLAAAMWEDPHILVLDEPTNYLDRDSLGALATALKSYNGGVVIISHNREFTDELGQETWICEGGRLRREGESFVDLNEKLVDPNDPLNMAEKAEVKDSFGNVVKVEGQKKKLAGAALKKYKKLKEGRKKRGEEVSESDEDWQGW